MAIITFTNNAVHLPAELYRGIAESLHPHKDIDTLISFCQASRALAHEGQRVLFSMGPLTKAENVKRNAHITSQAITDAYTAFMDTIIEKRHFAKHVLSYEHFSGRNSDLQPIDAVALATLTMRALPLMVNLEKLRIDLSAFDMEDMSRICWPKLHTLSIDIFHIPPAHLTAFLCSQPTLRHLQINDGAATSGKYTVILADERIPRQLCSLWTNNPDLWSMLAGTRNIKALSLKDRVPGSVTKRHAEAMSKVKCLRIDSNMLDDVRNMLLANSKFEYGIKILQIDKCSAVFPMFPLEECLPYLHILIINDYMPVWRASEPLLLTRMRKLAMEAFAYSDTLMYVIIPCADSPKGAYLYLRPFRGTERKSYPGERKKCHATILQEHDVSFDASAMQGPDWWIRWADLLANQSQLGIEKHISGRLIDMGPY